MGYWFRYSASDGVIAEVAISNETEWTNVPNGYAMLGPLVLDDTIAQDAANKKDEYTVQNGQLVHSNAPTAVEQLASAQSAQKALLFQSFEHAINVGFPSSASGASAMYSIDGNAMAKWNGILSLINSGTLTSNITVKDINGVKVTLTPTQFKQFALDGFNYFNTQEQHLWTKEDDVNAANTIADVQAVTW